jgi:anti-anti-sigma regulatory factor
MTEDGGRRDVVVRWSPQDPESTLDEVRKRLPLLLDAPPTSVVVDLSAVPRLSSGVVAALLLMGETCRRRGVPVRLRHVPPGGAATLRRTGLSSALALEEAGS